VIPAGRLTLEDLHHARGLYGGELTCIAGAWRLVGAKIAGEFVTLGPVWSDPTATLAERARAVIGGAA
jgi:hypothetical protein